MAHSICEAVFQHKYLSTIAMMLLVAAVFVRGGEADLKATAASWQQAHIAKMSIVD